MCRGRGLSSCWCIFANRAVAEAGCFIAFSGTISFGTKRLLLRRTLCWTEAAIMPPIAVGIGMIPYFIKKIGFLFVMSSLAAGVAGGFVLYNVAATALSPTAHFATAVIGVLLLTFCVSGIASGILAIYDVCRHLSRRLAT